MSSRVHLTDPSGNSLGEKSLLQLPLKIGRAPDNDIVVQHSSVSRYHCRIESRASQIWIVDQDSVNGVKLNGLKHKEMQLDRSMALKIGEITVHVEIEIPAPQSTPVATMSSDPSEENTTAGHLSTPNEEKTVTFQLKTAPTHGFVSAETVIRQAPKLTSLPQIKKPSFSFDENTQSSLRTELPPPQHSELAEVPMPEKQASVRSRIQQNLSEQLARWDLGQVPWKWVLGVVCLSLMSWWTWKERLFLSSVDNNLSFWSFQDNPSARPLSPDETLDFFKDAVSGLSSDD